MQGSTSGAVAAIGRIAGRMQEIDSCATSVSAAVEEQNRGDHRDFPERRQRRATAPSWWSRCSREVAGAAIETRQSAESVLSASQAVEAAAAELRKEVEDFLARVAA